MQGRSTTAQSLDQTVLLLSRYRISTNAILAHFHQSANLKTCFSYCPLVPRTCTLGLSPTHNSPVAMSKISHRKQLRMCIPDCRGRHLLHKIKCMKDQFALDCLSCSAFTSFPLLQASQDAARVLHAKQYTTKSLLKQCTRCFCTPV